MVLNKIEAITSIRKGSKLSRLFRHIFERRYVKSFLGSNIALFVLASSFLPISGATQITGYEEAEEQIISQAIVEFKTEKNIQNPTEEMILNQGYSWFHRGLDIEGDTGDPIKSIMPGIVSDIQYSNFGYGNAVIVSHGDDFSTLYAHMSKITVEPRQRVTLDTVIGEVGSTGRSTGDHLHLEVRSGNTTVNPLTILP